MTEKEYARLAEGQVLISKSKLLIDDKKVSIDDVERIAREQHAISPVGLVVVDYLQLMRFKERKGRTNEEEVNDAGIRLKDLAKELSCVTIALTQFARDGQASRCIALRHHSDIYLKIRKDDQENRFVEIDKQRDGAVGEVAVGWHGIYAAVS